MWYVASHFEDLGLATLVVANLKVFRKGLKVILKPVANALTKDTITFQSVYPQGLAERDFHSRREANTITIMKQIFRVMGPCMLLKNRLLCRSLDLSTIADRPSDIGVVEHQREALNFLVSVLPPSLLDPLLESLPRAQL